MNTFLRIVILGASLVAAPVWAQEHKINIHAYTFTPPELTVTAGTTVTWTNHDQEPHGVVEKDKKFHSAALDTNDSYSFTFTKPGTYHYFCTLHPHMTGTITVVKGK